jgi:hypothetical protein
MCQLNNWFRNYLDATTWDVAVGVAGPHTAGLIRVVNWNHTAKPDMEPENAIVSYACEIQHFPMFREAAFRIQHRPRLQSWNGPFKQIHTRATTEETHVRNDARVVRQSRMRPLVRVGWPQCATRPIVPNAERVLARTVERAHRVVA